MTFSQGALFEIGSSLTLFRVLNHSEEFIKAAAGQRVVSPIEQDESIAPVADEIEETTRDFVIKTLATELKGHPLADFVDGEFPHHRTGHRIYFTQEDLDQIGDWELQGSELGSNLYF